MNHRTATLSAGRRPANTRKPLLHSRSLPGLSGRSVRNLDHLNAVKAASRAMVAVISALAVVVGAGIGFPAYAQAIRMDEAPIVQTLRLATTAEIPPVIRDTYTATSPPPLQWPVEQHSIISDGFGPRVPPCSGCSSFHNGVDLDAGWGSRVYAIAAGVVVETSNPFDSSLGVHVTIEHNINGQILTSVYGHMQYGSMPLSVGDTVYTGQVIGLVGNTGASTGPHLHFEIRLGGTDAVAPMEWMHARLG